MRFFAGLLQILVALCFAGNAMGQSNVSVEPKGAFIVLKTSDGNEVRAYAAGPIDAKAGVLVVHDYMGISESAKHSVEHLAALGYRTVAVDLYGGKSAASHEEAVKLMQSLDRKTTDRNLQAGLDYLKKPGRRLATLGFSMGGIESLNANLNDSEAVSVTAIIYGFGFDKTEISRLEKLKGPVLVVTGSEDTGAVEAAVNFRPRMKDAKRPYELFIYPGADHGYAQPLFNGGKNYDAEAVRVTWVVVDDFFKSHLKP